MVRAGQVTVPGDDGDRERGHVERGQVRRPQGQELGDQRRPLGAALRLGGRRELLPALVPHHASHEPLRGVAVVDRPTDRRPPAEFDGHLGNQGIGAS